MRGCTKGPNTRNPAGNFQQVLEEITVWYFRPANARCEQLMILEMYH
jgi:hypothetical protein